MDSSPDRIGSMTVFAAGGEVFRRLRSLYSREWLLFGVGATGVLLGTACLVLMATRGRYIPPEGDLMKPASFDIAVGLYMLTLALYAPFARFSRRGHAVWAGFTAFFALFGYGVETVQQLRGVDPRFSSVATVPEQLLGLTFFVSALTLIPLFAILIAKLRRGRARELLHLSIGYAAASVAVGFGSGIWMSARGGSSYGAADILPLHAVGFHGIQAVPLVALLLVWAGTEQSRARGIVHSAGVAWLVACGAVLMQTLSGGEIYRFTPAAAVALLALVAWAATMLRAVLAWRASGWNVPPLPAEREAGPAPHSLSTAAV